MSSDLPRIGAIVQARLGSQRLPGKVLRDVQGKPLLQYALERVREVQRLDRIVVATSTDKGDDALADWCAAFGVDCLRGSLQDVAGRFADVLH
ncbi:MAG: acylneuraminate cytidylyltransferase, partial [Planctomycetaceae bacterium]